MQRKTILAICALAFLTISAACAGPVLDDILNYMFKDQTVPMKGPQNLWIVDRSFALTKDEPVGQTFMTGPETAQVVRIWACLIANEDWNVGEGAEMVLWDSPAKKTPLGRYTIWYEFRGYHFSHTDWEVKTRVQPNTAYYFEISYVGSGDGKLGRIGVMNGTDNYKSGQGYLAGKETDFDLCFQIHSKRAENRIANLKKAFARFDLDRPELAEVKQAVQKEDFDTAITKTVSYFEARTKPWAVINQKDTPGYGPAYDTKMADLAMQNYFMSGEMGEGYAGPDLNWRADVSFDEQGRKIAGNYELNRSGPRTVLGGAYIKTSNEKYAKKLNDMFIDWFLDNPPPPESNIGGQPWDPVWSSLNTGIRLGQAYYAYSQIHKSPNFTLDCRMGYIFSMADHAETLVMVGAAAGGNWAFTQNGSLMTFAVNFPEFKNSKLWFDTATERISNGLKKDYMPDGVEGESAPGYQRMAYKPVAHIYELLKERGVKSPFGDELKDLLERHAEYFMYMAMPNGGNPFLGDWGGDKARPLIKEDAERFNRQDMLYVATGGQEGAKPQELSKLYPYTGIVTMRSDWGDAGRPYEDGRYLMLHGLHYGAHGHADVNSINVYAYGRELLGDPGSHIYGSPEHTYLTSAVSHNLMTIDGGNQDRGCKTDFRNWSTTPIADYLSSFTQAYKSGGYNREAFYIRSNGDPGAKEYWIVRDTAEGEGNHSLEQRWHFVLDSGATVNKSDLVAKTAFADKGNLAILQVDPSRLQVEETTADTWHPRGTSNKPAQKMPLVIYKTNTTLPAAIDTALVPFEGAQPIPAQLKTLEKSADGLDSAFKMTQGKVEDLFVFQKTAGAKTLASEKVSFNGERLFVRKIGGKLRSALLINGTSLEIGGKQIVKTEKPLLWVAIMIDGKEVKAYTSSEEPSLSVPANGKKVSINNMNVGELVNPPIEVAPRYLKKKK
ncbi:MAG: heparinase II/III family protein [Armatimonadota bacterium]|nr:heparinase II/III family protein [Armatimonadota bacterium]